MTCPPNAFESGQDLIVLAPRESVTVRWGIREPSLERTAASRRTRARSSGVSTSSGRPVSPHSMSVTSSGCARRKGRAPVSPAASSRTAGQCSPRDQHRIARPSLVGRDGDAGPGPEGPDQPPDRIGPDQRLVRERDHGGLGVAVGERRAGPSPARTPCRSPSPGCAPRPPPVSRPGPRRSPRSPDRPRRRRAARHRARPASTRPARPAPSAARGGTRSPPPAAPLQLPPATPVPRRPPSRPGASGADVNQSRRFADPLTLERWSPPHICSRSRLPRWC